MKKENLKVIHQVWWMVLGIVVAFAIIGVIFAGDPSVAKVIAIPAILIAGWITIMMFQVDDWDRELDKKTILRSKFLKMIQGEEIMTIDIDGQTMIASPTNNDWGYCHIVDRAKERGLQLFIKKNGRKWVPISNYM